jgi:hypothetical protein
MEPELNRNYEVFTKDYSYIEQRHKIMLKEQVRQNVAKQFPWMDPHLNKIVVQTEYKNTLEAIDKEHYLADLKSELDELL